MEPQKLRSGRICCTCLKPGSKAIQLHYFPIDNTLTYLYNVCKLNNKANKMDLKLINLSEKQVIQVLSELVSSQCLLDITSKITKNRNMSDAEIIAMLSTNLTDNLG